LGRSVQDNRKRRIIYQKSRKKELNIVETAFILIVSVTGFEYDVLEDLKDIPEVREAFILYGMYDIIIQLEGDSMRDLKKIIREIRQMQKVRSTLTMVTHSYPSLTNAHKRCL